MFVLLAKRGFLQQPGLFKPDAHFAFTAPFRSSITAFWLDPAMGVLSARALPAIFSFSVASDLRSLIGYTAFISFGYALTVF